MNRLPIYVILVGLLVALAFSATFTVKQYEKALVVRLGKIIGADYQPGLHFKYPMIDEVSRFDARLLTLDADPERYFTSEKKNVIVDSYVKWRIDNVEQYFISTSGGDENRARLRLDERIKAALRAEFGNRTVQEVISGERREIMTTITKTANENLKDLGIAVEDVRIKRIDLPLDVNDAVYQRMRAERQRIARDLRSKGREASEKIKAGADKTRTVLLAEAYSTSETIRGDGDAKATETYANAYNKNREFYSFYRSLSAYKKTFSNQGDIIILEPESDFFKYFKSKDIK